MTAGKKQIVLIIQPLECLGNGEALPVFGKVITSDLITELSHFKQFIIQSGAAVSSPGQLPAGDYLVQGTLTQYEEEINLNIHLTRLADLAIIWSYRNARIITSIQQVQQEMLGQLVASLQQQLDLDLISRLRNGKITDFKVYEYWLYGLNELKKGTVASDDAARKYFAKALEIDPNYGLAYSGMSLSYFNEWSCQVWDRWDLSQKGAKDWALKALKVDPENYIANMILGKVLLFEHSFSESEIYLRKALRLNSIDPFNLIQVAGSFVYFNYLEEAESLYLKALSINPDREEHYHPIGAFIYLEKSDFTRAIEVGERFVNRSWVDFPAVLAAACYYLGDHRKARQYWDTYLDDFERCISKDKKNIPQEALQWMINLNPFTYESALVPFWKFISPGSDPQIPTREAHPVPNLFQRDHTTWKLRYLGREAHLPHSKGLADISRLLERAGEEIGAEELLGGRVRQEPVAIIDKKALLSVKHRLQEIEEALIHCIDDEDGKAEALKDEYDRLTGFIRSSVDKKGRIRVKGSVSEKARSAVTQRIKSALKKIGQVHPELGLHLSSSISTGTYCSYKPERAIRWEL